MERKRRKTRRGQATEKFFGELATRSMIIMLLMAFTVLLVRRPPWAVQAVRLILGAARSVGTYL